MTNNGWKAIGRIAKARRERLGLKQDELAQYGGPGVATVGKFERGAQDSFPTRTQHQMENALGWSRTIVEQVVKSINEGALTIEDWEYDLVEEDVPDLSQSVDGDNQHLEEAVDAVRVVLRLIAPDRLEAAVRAALIAVVPMLTEQSAVQAGAELQDTFLVKGGDGHDADELAGRRAAPMTSDKDELSEVDETLPSAAKEQGIQGPGEDSI